LRSSGVRGASSTRVAVSVPAIRDIVQQGRLCMIAAGLRDPSRSVYS
jgi:hypothetical protein